MTSHPEPRTVEERAREIRKVLLGAQAIPSEQGDVDYIAAALREYGDEARAEGLIRGFDKGWARGFSDCQDKASNLLVKNENRRLKMFPLLCEFANIIRALSPSEGGTK